MLIYNVRGSERKRLATLISEKLEIDCVYLGTPTFAYSIGDFTVNKDGNLEYGEIDVAIVNQLSNYLREEGFIPINADEDKDGVEVKISSKDWMDIQKQNLRNILKAKGWLIRKSLGIEEEKLLKEIDGVFIFHWLPKEVDDETKKAIHILIENICKLAKTTSRTSSKETIVVNEKYAFRCFLLRLGFIGEKYKAARKVLLKNLKGSSSYRIPKETKIERAV